MQHLRPLVKWAGGKRQIIKQIISMFPDAWNVYFEPFVGGGAVMVELYNLGLLNRGLISDMNCELINLYEVVKEDTDGLLDYLSSFPIENNSVYYNRMREKFNEISGDHNSKLERSALFMYLNRFGYNGLWRVNSKGRFNVPFGDYANPSLPDREHLKNFGVALSKVEIACQDFEKTCDRAKMGDFVYLDPPYFPLSKTSFFTGYTPGGFPLEEQKRLLKVCISLSNRGVKFLLSNSFSPEIIDLYREFKIKTISARRSINSVGSARSGQKELLITNY